MSTLLTTWQDLFPLGVYGLSTGTIVRKERGSAIGSSGSSNSSPKQRNFFAEPELDHLSVVCQSISPT